MKRMVVVVHAPEDTYLDEAGIAKFMGTPVIVNGSPVGKVVETHAGPSSLLREDLSSVLYDKVHLTCEVKDWVVAAISDGKPPVISINGAQRR